jgi:hypothetical protein
VVVLLLRCYRLKVRKCSCHPEAGCLDTVSVLMFLLLYRMRGAKLGKGVESGHWSEQRMEGLRDIQ